MLEVLALVQTAPLHATATPRADATLLGANAEAWKAIAELIGAVAWPLAVLVVAVALRRPLEHALPALAARLGSVSFSELRIEFLQTSNELSRIEIELATLSATSISASGPSSFAKAFEDVRPVDFAVVDLGTGRRWLASRLLIFLFVLARAKRLRYCVFVRPIDGRRGILLGTATVDDVVAELLRLFPWFQRPFVDAVWSATLEEAGDLAGWGTLDDVKALQQELTWSQPPIVQPNVTALRGVRALFKVIGAFRRIDVLDSQQIARTFVAALQPEIGPFDPRNPNWTADVTSWMNPNVKVWEHSPWLDPKLEAMSRLRLDQQRIVRPQGISDSDLARCVLSDGDGASCAITDADGAFVGLADRAGILSQLARNQIKT